MTVLFNFLEIRMGIESGVFALVQTWFINSDII